MTDVDLFIAWVVSGVGIWLIIIYPALRKGKDV